MRIRVLFFAHLRELSGEAERFVEAEEGTKTGGLAGRLLHRPGGLPLLYAVNETFVDENHVLKDQDVLALMTPVSGG